jgi:hypothetical protein
MDTLDPRSSGREGSRVDVLIVHLARMPGDAGKKNNRTRIAARSPARYRFALFAALTLQGVLQ